MAQWKRKLVPWYWSQIKMSTKLIIENTPPLPLLGNIEGCKIKGSLE